MIIKIHAWQINGFCRLKVQFTQQLKKMITDIKDISNKVGLSSYVISSILRMSKESDSTNIKNIFRLTDFLKIPRETVEENIEYFTPSSSKEWKGTKIKFPLEVTPLWFRCAGVGDFTIIGEYHALVWCQNSIKPMNNLIKNLIGINSHYWVGGYSGLNERLYIPSIIRDSICAILGISKSEITTYKFVSACLRLPKPFRVQVLAQTIVDDGYCDKFHNRVSIHMKNKEIIRALHMLCQSLGYKSTIITRSSGNYKFNNFYDLILSVEGTLKFYNDLKQMIKIYGNFAGLWNKQHRFEEVVKRIDVKRLNRIEKARNYKRRILNLIKNREVITTNELMRALKIPRVKFFNYMSKLKREGLVRSVKKGNYSLCK